MSQTIDPSSAVEPAPVRISRTFRAPRETVFKAWSPADHVRHWFAPQGYTVPHVNLARRRSV